MGLWRARNQRKGEGGWFEIQRGNPKGQCKGKNPKVQNSKGKTPQVQSKGEIQKGALKGNTWAMSYILNIRSLPSEAGGSWLSVPSSFVHIARIRKGETLNPCSAAQRTWNLKANLLGPRLKPDQIRESKRSKGRFALGK